MVLPKTCATAAAYAGAALTNFVRGTASEPYSVGYCTGGGDSLLSGMKVTRPAESGCGVGLAGLEERVRV